MQKLKEQSSKNGAMMGASSFSHFHGQPHISLGMSKIEFIITKHNSSLPQN
jgi:hypothetical protein